MENFKFIVDPTGHYAKNNVSTQAVVETTGLLPAFMLGTEDTIAGNLEKNYRFFSHWTPADQTEATVTPEGVWQYPVDPDLYPLLVAQQGNEKVYIYKYAIVAVTVDDIFTRWSRMD